VCVCACVCVFDEWVGYVVESEGTHQRQQVCLSNQQHQNNHSSTNLEQGSECHQFSEYAASCPHVQCTGVVACTQQQLRCTVPSVGVGGRGGGGCW